MSNNALNSQTSDTVNSTNVNERGLFKILRVDSSSRYEGSVTRNLTDNFLNKLHALHGNVQVQIRDVAKGLPFIDETWVGANFTSPEQRSPEQISVLAQSDTLIKELNNADIVVIGLPIYNFGVPATLKSWIDLIARAGVTFRYTQSGPVGLLENKKAYVIIASGGTTIGSEFDYASGYIRHVLGFIGIENVEIINAERINSDNPEHLERTQQQLDQAITDLNKSLEYAA